MRILTSAAGLAVVAMLATPAKAQDAYVIGLTGALTGPSASTTAPPVEGLRIYIDRINAAGGINGKPVKLRILDDQADPQKAAANARQLVGQENAVLLINSSLSSTYAPVIAEAKRADVPLMFVGAVCPKEVYPPAESGQFCTSAFASNLDSSAALSFIKNTATDRVRIGLAGMTIPISRAEVDFAEGQASTLGMTVVDKEIIPPATTDYAPFATKLKAAKPNWVYAWAPWVTQLRTYEALRGLGWQGSFLTWAHQEAEDELKRRKDQELYVIGANALFQDGLPVQKEIAAAVAKAGSEYPASQMTEGWIGGLVIEAALKQAGSPATAATLTTALENLKVDVKGLRGGPIEWTKDNHYRLRQSYRIYKWDAAKGQIVLAKDWFGYEVN